LREREALKEDGRKIVGGWEIGEKRRKKKKGREGERQGTGKEGIQGHSLTEF